MFTTLMIGEPPFEKEIINRNYNSGMTVLLSMVEMRLRINHRRQMPNNKEKTQYDAMFVLFWILLDLTVRAS